MTSQDRGDEPVPYDTGEWVDVGRDGLWRPSGGERLRALTILGLAVGTLLVLAGIASVGGDDDEGVVASPTSSTEPEVVTTTSIPPTTALAPASLDGEAPPEICEADDARQGAPLRDRSGVVVLVLNGTSRSGHAGSVTADLDRLGYSTIVPSNASRLPVTTVEYTPGYCAESVELSSQLGVDGADVRALSENSDVFLGRAVVLVTLGSDSL